MDILVLVVDDSRLARRNACNILLRLRPEWRCIEAAHAEEALAIAGVQAPSVVLIDYNMPGQDGITLGRALAAMHPGASIAIVSANIQDSIIAAARELDFAFVPKPLTEDVIAPFLGGAALRLARR